MRDRHPAPKAGAAKCLTRFKAFEHFAHIKPVSVGEQLRDLRKHLGLVIKPSKRNRLR